MTTGEAIKLLKENGFSLLNQKGSHMKFGKDDKRFTLAYHSNDKERMAPKGKKQLLKLIEDEQKENKR